MSGEGSYALDAFGDRRRHQRIYVALVSPKRFHVRLGDGLPELPVYDLSLGGFSCAMPEKVPPGTFAFTLTCSSEAEPFTGTAEVRAVVANVRLGCQFVALEEVMQQRLKDWLVDYVRRNARVPLSREEAEAIVTGRSFL